MWKPIKLGAKPIICRILYQTEHSFMEKKKTFELANKMKQPHLPSIKNSIIVPYKEL